MNKELNETKKFFFSWGMSHNLQLIIDFHNIQHNLMGKQISIINESIASSNDTNEKKNLLLQKNTYINTYDDLLKVNTFLLMYSHLEEFLLLMDNPD